MQAHTHTYTQTQGQTETHAGMYPTLADLLPTAAVWRVMFMALPGVVGRGPVANRHLAVTALRPP